jgi:hypothetical protein
VAFIVLLMVGVVGVIAAPSAYAGTAQKFQGQACPGGYITYFIWSGPVGGGFGSYGGNAWSFTDPNYPGSGHYEIAVRCNNNVFYYPHFDVHGYAGTWWIGWI